MLYPRLQLRTNAIVFYYERDSYGAGYDLTAIRRRNNLKNTKTYSGEITAGSKRRLAKCVDLMLQSNDSYTMINKRGDAYRYKVSFTTLTISSKKNITHKEAYSKLLKPFLQWLTKTMKVTQYIWKEELQERGQIHFHLIINKFIHYKIIRNKWNYLQRKNGYLNDYVKEHGHYDANSTDIHGLKHVNNTKNYLLKYLLKKDKKTKKDKGKIWGASKELLNAKYFTIDFDTELQKRLYLLSTQRQLQEKTQDYFSYITVEGDYIRQLLKKDNLKNYMEHMEALHIKEEELF